MKVYCYTDNGGRFYNEDLFDVNIDTNRGLFVLADGLGGHGGGKVAAQEIIRAFKELWKKTKADKISKEMIKNTVNVANQQIVGMQTKEIKMKSTLAMLHVDLEDGNTIWAHVGDSRIYHFIDGKIVFCTFDHSVSCMAVLAGEIELEEVRFHIDRNRLLKAIGIEGFVVPEMEEEMLHSGRAEAFLLCTDGFWEYVTETEMEKTLTGAQTPDEWITRMRKILQSKVCDTNDNNTAIAIFI